MMYALAFLSGVAAGMWIAVFLIAIAPFRIIGGRGK
jgi:hypothetical protein